MARTAKPQNSKRNKSGGSSSSKKPSPASKSSSKKNKKTKSARRNSSGGGGGGKSKSSGAKGKKSKSNVSEFGPFNVRPISRKQQSRKDKKLHERSVQQQSQLKSKKSNKGGGGGKYRRQKDAPHRAFSHGERSPKYKLGRHGEMTTSSRRGGERGGRERIFNTKAVGRKTKKGKPFVVHLPPEHSCPEWTEVPWYDSSLMADDAVLERHQQATIGNNSSSSAAAAASSAILPTSGISEDALARLDAELEAFSRYVRLTTEEIDARNYVVDHVRELAINLFEKGRNNFSAGKKRGRRRLDTWSDDEFDEKKDDEDDGVRVVAFGSFAAPEVCTYLSDVDLALWGAVPVPAPLFSGTHTRFQSDDDENDSIDDEGPKLSQSALERTMEALEAAATATEGHVPAEATNTSPQFQDDKEERVQRWRKALEGASPDDSGDKSVEGQSDSVQGLFVIDREGQFDSPDANVEAKDSDDGNEQSEDAPNEEEKKQRDCTNEGTTTTSNEGNEFNFIIDRDGAKDFGHEEVTESAAPEYRKDVGTQQQQVAPEPQSGDGSDTQGGKDNSQDSAGEDTTIEQGAKNETETKPANEVITIDDDDDNDSEEEVICLSDEDDNADKMESFGDSRKRSAPNNNTDQYIVDLLSDASDSESEDYEVQDRLRGFMNSEHSDDDDVEVSFMQPRADKSLGDSTQPTLTIGPTGKAREQVITALRSLGRKLWASPLTDTVDVRRHARVPIICVSTRLGFDGDIALAGHNGTDTSKYASSQVQRYKSFASVVLLLKILLYQTGLDKPFTGGLGSYKLYVLVAHHLDQHLALGGSDRPSEVFACFLYRYGGIKGFRSQCHKDAATELVQTSTLSSDGGHADLDPVFRVAHCAEVFERCFRRLMHRLQNQSSKGSASFLGSLINCTKLELERGSSISKAKRAKNEKKKAPAPIGRTHPGKVNPGRKVGHVFSKGSRSFSANSTTKDPDTDDEAEKLMQGYGVQRGPRGTLIPRSRPDVDARREAERNNPSYELFGRASKNRKNKKKQKRDSAVRDFARASSM